MAKEWISSEVQSPEYNKRKVSMFKRLACLTQEELDKFYHIYPSDLDTLLYGEINDRIRYLDATYAWSKNVDETKANWPT